MAMGDGDEGRLYRSLAQYRGRFVRYALAVRPDLSGDDKSQALMDVSNARHKYLNAYDAYCDSVSVQVQRDVVHADRRSADLLWTDAVSTLSGRNIQRPRENERYSTPPPPRLERERTPGNGHGENEQYRQWTLPPPRSSADRLRASSHAVRSDPIHVLPQDDFSRDRFDHDDHRDRVDRFETSTTISDSPSVNRNNDIGFNLVRAVDRMNIVYSFVWDGSPSGYTKFMTYFQKNFIARSFDEDELLNHLIKCVSGKALRAIQHYEGTQDGYTVAMGTLQRRFGKTYDIVSNTLSRMTEGARLKHDDIDALNDYASLLEGGYQTLRTEGATHEANSEQFLVKVFNKLPQQFQQKWLSENQKIRDTKNRQPKFREMVKFVMRMAETNDTPYHVKPNYSSSQSGGGTLPGSSRGSMMTPPQTAKPRVTTLASQVYSNNNAIGATSGEQSVNQGTTGNFQSQSRCAWCQAESHSITNCQSFADLPVRRRRSFVELKRLCYQCLEQHFVRDCPGALVACNVSGCDDSRPHHRLLHKDSNSFVVEQSTRNRPIPAPRTGAGGERSTPSGNTIVSGASQFGTVNKNNPGVLLHIVPVRIFSDEDTSVTTFAMVDSGSQGTLLDKRVLERLGLGDRLETEVVSVTTVTGRDWDVDVTVLGCKLAPITGDGPLIEVPRVLAVDDLPLNQLTLPGNVDAYPHLQGLDLRADVDIQRVSMLIGQDVPQAHMQLETRFGDHPASEPYAVKSIFGWSVAGPVTSQRRQKPVLQVGFLEIDVSNQALESAVRTLWDLERHGFTNDDQKCPSVEDQKCLDILKNTTRLEDGRYSSGMLWRNDPPYLPNSLHMAEQRLEQLTRRFKRDAKFYEIYKGAVDDYIAKGYARRMSESEALVRTPKTWYLPHHAVFNVNKPGKCRVVQDAAAATQGVSLNSALCHGPDLTNSLLGCLMRFRQDEVAIVADIESMFHRVLVSSDDRDALRFLWVESLDSKPCTYQMLSHIFGAADSPTVCTYALQQCARDQAAKFDPRTSHAVMRNFYFDDLLKSLPNVELSVELALQLIAMLDNGGFKLTKFQSNRVEVLQALPPDRVSPHMKELDVGSVLPVERALGTRWDIESDTLGVKVQTKDFPSTRRGCLAQVCSTFDPCGIVAPVTLVGKRILQQACRLQIGWDDPLPDELMPAWLTWKSELELLDGLSIPRCYFTRRDIESLTLHHFSDACEHGYGTVSYLRAEFADGEVQVAFLMAKSRTTPSNFTTVARLELQACVVAARVHSFIVRELDLLIHDIRFYTDSTIAYQYITTTTKRYHTYVFNRTTEFRDLADPSKLVVIAGSENPADEVSRGCSPRKLLENTRLLQGPAFLLKPSAEWPVSRPGALPDDDPEVKPERFVMTVLPKEQVRTTMHDFIKRHSSLSVMVRRVALLQKFINFMRSKRLPDQLEPSPVELVRAMDTLVRIVQRENFGAEVKQLTRGGYVSASSPLKKLNPQLVDGLIRVGGRIKQSMLPYDAKFPLILPKSHALTTAVILYYHVRCGHSGSNHVLGAIRERYWIIHGKSSVKKLLRNCFKCRRLLAQKMEQMMSDLPDVRLTTYVPPFQKATGCDFFGPLKVKRGRAVVKRYGCLFTCMHTRSVHLEMADSLDTCSFINAFRRFTARRGVCEELWTDNGTNFVGAEREMREFIEHWNCAQLEVEFRQDNIKWHFLPPGASHMAGVWERLVRSTKRALYAVLQDTLANDDVLNTALAETERILNGRPLCSVSDDPRDLEVLTPNHFLIQRNFANLPPGLFDQSDMYRSRWRQVQYIADCIWKRFVQEYIPSLQERAKWLKGRRNAEIGDIVLISDEILPRGQWLVGRIVRVNASSDGRVRSATVKTRASKLTRPVNKLCLLEAAG